MDADIGAGEEPCVTAIASTIIFKAVAPMEIDARAGLHKQPATITCSAVAAEVGITEVGAGVTDKQPTTEHTGTVRGETDAVNSNTGIALHPHTTTGTITGGTVGFIYCECFIIKADTYVVMGAVTTKIHTANTTATSTCNINATTVFSTVAFKLAAAQIKT